MPEANPIRPTTPEAIQLAKSLLRTSRYGAIAVLTRRPAGRWQAALPLRQTWMAHRSFWSPDWPRIRRACWQTLPARFCSARSARETLAHARVTLHCQARKVEKTDADYPRIRRRYLNHNPKGSLYVDLGDFAFFRLELESASLNGGFGKAFNLTRDDLLCAASVSANFAEGEQKALDNLNENYALEIAHIARGLSKSDALREQFKIVGIDPDGADITSGDLVLRHVFSAQPDSLGKLLQH